jgi:alpha-D-ribose 1-methylphosphonate 5-triphosphate diphosphatase PhnM
MSHKSLELHQAISYISQQPAEAAGLTDRGSLRVGNRADLVVLHEKSVVAMWSGGRQIYQMGLGNVTVLHKATF